MKIYTTIFFVFLFWNFAFSQFTFTPQKPKLKDTVNVNYVPQNELSQYKGEIKASVLYFPKNQIGSLPKAIELQNNNNAWVGTLKPFSENTVGFLIVFRDSTDKILDNNKGRGFSGYVYDSLDKPIYGAYLGLALTETYTSVNPLFKIVSDPKKQLILFENEFERNPNLKNTAFLPYIFSIQKAKPDNYQKKMEVLLDEKYANHKDMQPMEAQMIKTLYEVAGNKEKAEKITTMSIKNNPNGILAQSEKMRAISQEMDSKKKVALFESYIKEFPKNPLNYSILMGILPHYLKIGKWQKGKTMYSIYEEKNSRFNNSSFFYNIAFALFNDKTDLPFADSMALESIKLKQKENLNQKNGFLMYDKTINEYYFNYASILELQKKDSLAYENFKLAKGDSLEKSNPEINEKYILSAIKTGHLEEAKIEGLKIIMAGKSTKKLKFVLSDLLAKADSNNSISIDSLNKIELIELNKKVENYGEKAQDFTLMDQKGKAWTLASLKGKIVVLDFWASWCAPCIRSFPAMKMSVSKYKNDSNVIFVFINSWEKLDKSSLQKFINSKGINNLLVLFDENDKAIESFGIKSIPTKIFLDKNGAIRHKISGFDGDNETTINEISKLVDSMKEEL